MGMQRNAAIAWKPVKGAVGYNVLWGIRPDRLTLTYQRWADQGAALELRALDTGQGRLGRGRGVRREWRVEAEQGDPDQMSLYSCERRSPG
jgi:hypothetical protein